MYLYIMINFKTNLNLSKLDGGALKYLQWYSCMVLSGSVLLVFACPASHSFSAITPQDKASRPLHGSIVVVTV